MKMNIVEQKLHKELESQGFWRYRDYFMWGYCPGYKNEAGELRYIEGNKIYTGEDLYIYLIDVWRPHAQDECDYFLRMAAAGHIV